MIVTVAIIFGILLGFLFHGWRDSVKRAELERKAKFVHLGDLADFLCKAEGGTRQVNAAQVRDLLAELGNRWRGLTWEQASEEAWAIRDRAGRS